MIYHLLPELEVFSAYRGGAIAKNVANMMRFDRSRVVVCQAADDTWGFGTDRILVIPALQSFAKLHRSRSALPAWVTTSFFRYAFRRLLSMLQAGDVVWCHSQPSFCAALERSIHLKKAKLIYHSHSSVAPWFKRSKFRLFTADAYIFVSDAMRQEALRFLPSLKHTYAIHNGADDSRFYPMPRRTERTTAVILFVGRIHRTKGVHVLLEAMKILQEREVNAVCRVVGSSFSGGSRATSYVRSLMRNRPSNLQFVDHRSATEIAEEFRAADVLCCPSIWQEPFGNVNIEAMACGVPVVATRVGGIPEIASEGGVTLVEPGSAVGVADALQRLVEDKNLRLEVGAEGLKSFQRRFTWEVIVRQYQGILNSL